MTQPDLSLGEIERIVAGQHHDPHSVLGAHPHARGVKVPARTIQHVADLGEIGNRAPLVNGCRRLWNAWHGVRAIQVLVKYRFSK